MGMHANAHIQNLYTWVEERLKIDSQMIAVLLLYFALIVLTHSKQKP